MGLFDLRFRFDVFRFCYFSRNLILFFSILGNTWLAAGNTLTGLLAARAQRGMPRL